MSDPTFSQSERRNLLAPILIAAAVLILVFALLFLLTPHRVADATVTQVSVQPEHTSFVTGSKVVGTTTQSEDDLYVLATVRIHDDLGLPLFIKDLTGTMTTPDGTDITTSAIEKNDLDSVYQAFPSLKSMSGPPLLREIEIAPGTTAEGMVMLHYSATDADWKQRKSASITVEFYHQDPITVPITQ